LDDQKLTEGSVVHSFLSGLEILPLIDLGNHGYADTFIPFNRLTESEPTFPLVVGGDLQSGIFQNMHPTPAFDRYNAFEYSYTSSNSMTSKEHWHELLLFLKKRFELEKLSNFLRKQADLCENIIKVDRYECNFFLVGFFGKGFPRLLQVNNLLF
jgi:hypothetical protein